MKSFVYFARTRVSLTIFWVVFSLASLRCPAAQKSPALHHPNDPQRDPASESADSAAHIDSVEALNGLASLLESKGRYTAAISYWKRSFAIKADAATGVSLGIALYQDGKLQDATDSLQAVLKINPDRKDAHFALAGVYAHEKRFREAAVEYGLAFQLDPTDTETLIAKTNALISAEAYAEALEPAQECVRRMPGDWKSHLLLGGVESELGRYQEAEDNLRFVIASQPDNAVALYEMGRVFTGEENFELAVSHLQRAVSLDPSNTAAAFTLARDLRKIGQRERSNEILERINRQKEQDLKQSQLSPLISQANDLLRANHATDAVAIYNQILDADPKNARVEYDLALALGTMKDAADERLALQHSIELDPQLAVAKLEMGHLEESSGNTELARKWYQAAIQTNPQMAEAKDALGALEAQGGDGADSVALFREAIEDDPSHLQPYLDLAAILGKQGQVTAANRILSQATHIVSGDPQFILSAAKIMRSMGEDEEALSLIQGAVKSSPRLLDARLELVITLAQLYQLPAALRAADQTIQSFPGSARALFIRGRILYYLSRNDEAEADFLAAIRVDRDFAEPYYLSGLIKKHEGSYIAAADRFADSARLQPNNSMVWYQLGSSLELASRKQEAIQALRQAVTVDGGNLLSLESLEEAYEADDKSEAEQVESKVHALEQTTLVANPVEVKAAGAVALMKADDWPQAMAVLHEALLSCGTCADKPKLLTELGLVKSRTGDLKGGEEELAAARMLDPKNVKLKELLSKLKEARQQTEASSTSVR